MYRTLLFLLGSLSVVFAGTPSSSDAPLVLEDELPRVESFVLHPRGKRWQSDRSVVGTAKLVSSKSFGSELLEMELELREIQTRIQRTYRSELEAGGTYVFREWRSKSGGSQAGRSLILESLPTATYSGQPLLREWAGGGVRRELPDVPADSMSMLQMIERERGLPTSAPMAEWRTLFDDLEGTWEPALLVRTPLAPGLLRGVHLLDVFPSSGARHSRWLFQGEELLGFLEGNFEASRDLASAGSAVASAAPSSL